MLVSLALFSAQRLQLKFHACPLFSRKTQVIRAVPHNRFSFLVMKHNAEILDFEERLLDPGNRSYRTLFGRVGRTAGPTLFYA